METVFVRLHHDFGLERERPHQLEGFQTRLAARAVLHNFCIWLNRQLGRPSLAFRRLAGLVAPPISHQALKCPYAIALAQGYRIWILVNWDRMVDEETVVPTGAFQFAAHGSHCWVPVAPGSAPVYAARTSSSAQCPFRFRAWSSLQVTSNTQCSRFSIPQWLRTMSLNCSGGKAWLSRQ